MAGALALSTQDYVVDPFYDSGTTWQIGAAALLIGLLLFSFATGCVCGHCSALCCLYHRRLPHRVQSLLLPSGARVSVKTWR